ncbi:MAG: N-acetylmuramoyl-L-alanine amidase [Chthoniobacter sp.]|jgi:N-acetylmuramoyl-L-alanine amidase|nr:N-acetylmuramoyl-L-alanine amidase [Chthoniobacter sp.]
MRAEEAPAPAERQAARKVTAKGRAPAPGINLQQMIIPPGRVGRRIQFPLRATYITIHSTSNRGATALQHARGQLNGSFRGRTRWNRTGYVSWHFTVDDRVAIQSLPLDIQGEHADHEGPGNQTSIAIEICEFRDPRRQAAAVDRAARLTAWLMREKGIPLSNVVPHYHWPQHHFHDYQKPCPRIFMDWGRPGPRWQAYLRKVDGYS